MLWSNQDKKQTTNYTVARLLLHLRSTPFTGFFTQETEFSIRSILCDQL